MSQLKSKRRSQSKAKYVNVAYDIHTAAMELAVRLSPRYGRVYTAEVAALAHKLSDECEITQKIYPSNEQRVKAREFHLCEARGALSALDSKLTEIYVILLNNPRGAFTTGSGKKIPAKDAERILENLAENVGTLIDIEDTAISGVLDSDRKLKF